MELTRRQKLDFHEYGYLKLSGIVPRVMVDAARHAINHSIGNVGMHEEDLATMRARSYCQELQKDPVLTDLFNKTPIVPLAESLVGAGNVLPAASAQIALRFPGPLTADPGEPRGHLDGLGTGTNGMPAHSAPQASVRCSRSLSDRMATGRSADRPRASSACPTRRARSSIWA